MLPRRGEFSPRENYCENLRPATVAGGEGLVPVGRPRVILSGAAHVCVLPDGRILSVGSDNRSVSINGVAAGVLDADYRAAMTDADRVAIFTDGGVQWLASGALQPAPDANFGVELSVAPGVVSLSAPLNIAAKLKGSYPRLSGPLQDVDCLSFSMAFGEAMKSLSAQAALRGMLTQPAWIGWRIVDIEGHTLAVGEPQRLGSLQGEESVSLTATKDGATFTITGSGSMRANAWTVRLKVARSASEFWRRRARVLELVVYRDCAAVAGASGRFTEASGSSATLSVAPVIVETPRGEGVIAARFDMPLAGVDTSVFLTDLGRYNAVSAAAGSDFIPTAVCYGGTLRLYALSGEPGVIGVARADEPLTLRLKQRICEGQIVRITTPVGSGGGWNYGRHHFLAFTTAGIYAVSIDSALRSLSAAPVSPESIARADAVAIGPESIFCATAAGKLLKLTGSRTKEITFPSAAACLGYSARYSELWVADSQGRVLVLGTDGSMSARTVVNSVSGFPEQGLASTAGGQTVSLNDEEAAEVAVCLRVRKPDSATQLMRREEFIIDSEKATALKIAISGDGGGQARQLVAITASGPVNAPLRVVYRAPRRAYQTLEISGRLAAESRLAGRKRQAG